MTPTESSTPPIRNKAFVVRLYPNTTQTELINRTLGCARFVYNHFLARRIETYRQDGKSITYAATDKELTLLKRAEGTLWLAAVDKFALQQSLRDLEKAYQNFFRTVKTTGRKVGFPKFRKKRTGEAYRTQFTNDNIEIGDHCLKLPKLGWIKTRGQPDIHGKILNVTVRRVVEGHYEATVLCQVEIPYLPAAAKFAAGVDVGIKAFAIVTGGNGEFDHHANPKFYRSALRKFRKAQKTLSKRKRGSVRYRKAKTKLARIHRSTANRRQDFIHKLTISLVREYEVICTEHLKPVNMVKNRQLALSISDTGWGEFIRQLEYKSLWYGRLVSKISPYFPSSQLCHDCGFKNPEVKNLAVRMWRCPNCRETHDRDENAALNIRREGLVAAGMADTLNAHGDGRRPTSVGSGLRSENHATSVV
ncbi:IS200/IS605 family element RNA-guided endonuclease TnpB [Deinococcus alpinitundrae]|uniref:IS200/IS605 family element RNA-guided endonuclease TnpB n=1 Tax=Deinococcus alpinitundrae TaxID=468913 RepID=UPI001ED93A03|nr:IS200/IS605 family element RNA-guided endonuclease TnpB [Deinococcus alpinitundrae]